MTTQMTKTCNRAATPQFSTNYSGFSKTRLLHLSNDTSSHLRNYLSVAADGSLYPPTRLRRQQSRWCRRHLSVRQSTFPHGGLGLFTTVDLPEGTLLGCYGGVLVQGLPPHSDYLLHLQHPNHSRLVDAQPHLSVHGYLGRINEYVWSAGAHDPITLQNCKFSTDGLGLVYTTKTIAADTELTIYLGEDYNWDSLKYYLFRELYPDDTIPKEELFSYRNTLTRYNSILRLLDGDAPATNELLATHYFRIFPGPAIPPTPELSADADLPRCAPKTKSQQQWLAARVVRRTRHVQHVLLTEVGADYERLFNAGKDSGLTTSLYDAIVAKIPLPTCTLVASSRTVTELFQRTSQLQLFGQLVIILPYLFDGSWHVLTVNIGSHTLLHFNPTSSNPRVPQIRLLLLGLASVGLDAGSYRLFIVNSTARPAYQSGVLSIYSIYSTLHRWSPPSVSADDLFVNFRAQLTWSIYTASYAATDGGHENASHLTATRYGYRVQGSVVSLVCITPVTNAQPLLSASTSSTRSGSSTVSSELPSTPVFAPDNQCQTFHRPNRRCIVCGQTSLVMPNPSQRRLLQSYTDYCTMLSSQHTHDPNRYNILRSDLCICTFNINTLTSNKTLYLSWFIAHYCIDVLVIIDTRCDLNSSKYHKAMLQHYHPGAAVLVSPCSAPGRRAAHRVGGHFIFVAAQWAGSLSPYKSDHTQLGLLSTVTIHTSTCPVHITAVYLPFNSLHPTSHSLRQKLLQWIQSHCLHVSPEEYLLDHMANVVAQRPDDRHVFAGDFNSVWSNDPLYTWATSRNITNPVYNFTHPANALHGPAIYSHVTSVSQTLIDHILTYRTFASRVGCLDRVHCDVSDHQPIWIGIPIGSPLRPHHTPLAPVVGIRMKGLTSVQLETFHAHVTQVSYPLPANSSMANAVLNQLSQSIVASAIRIVKHKKVSVRKRYDGWSPPMIYYTSKLRYLTRAQQLMAPGVCSTRAELNVRLRHHLGPWSTAVARFTDEQRAVLPHDTTGLSYWLACRFSSTLKATVSSLIAAVKAQLHATERHQLHDRLHFFSKQIRQKFESHQLGDVIKVMLGRKSPLVDLSHLDISDSVRLTDPRVIHQHLTSHAEQYHGAGPTSSLDSYPWFSDTDTRDNFVATFREIVPARYHASLTHIWTGFHYPCDQAGFLQLEEATIAALSGCPSSAQFRSAVNSKSTRSTPGISGLSYHMLQLLPEETLELIYSCLVIFWRDLTVPDLWKGKYLCYIPKADGPTSVANLRPLMLVESLRKLWVDLILRPVIQLWNEPGVLSAAQHGYMHGRSTTSATLLLHSLLDSDKTLYINSWDFKGAFDAITNPLIDLSYRRLGFPAAIADWIHSLDRCGTTVVRTPYAQHKWSTSNSLTLHTHVASFTPGKGVGQGDVHSAHTWKICLDILLRAIESLNSSMSTADLLAALDAYADDVLTVNDSHEHTQAIADLVSLFSNLASLPLSVDKLRAFIRSNLPQPPQHIIVSTNGWAIRDIPLVLNGTLKYLGCLHNLSRHKRSYPLADPQYLRSLSQLTGAVDTLLTKRRLHYTPAILRSYLAKTIPQIVYGISLTITTSQQMDKLELAHRRLIKPLSLNMRQFPTKLIALPTQFGGLGVPSVQQAAFKARNRIFFSNLNSLSQSPIRSLIKNYATRQESYDGYVPTLSCTLRPSPTTASYLSPLIDFMAGTPASLFKRGYDITNGNCPIEVLKLTRSSIGRLKALGIDHLTDLIDTTGTTRSWRYPSGLEFLQTRLPNVDVISEPHTLHPGQLWVVRSRDDDSHDDALLLLLSSVTSVSVRLRVVDRTTSADSLVVSNSIVDFPTSNFRPVGKLFYSWLTTTTISIKGYLLAPLPTVPLPPMLPWIHHLRQRISLLPYKSFKVYTDGSWTSTTEPLYSALCHDVSIRASASIVIMAADDWSAVPILPVHITNDSAQPMASAYVLELIAIACAVSVVSDSVVHTDCQSAVKILAGDLNKQINCDYYNLLIYIADCLSRFHNALVWVPSHPERRQKNTSLWQQDDWGNHLADHYANSAVPYLSTFPIEAAYTVTTVQILKQIPTVDWCWSVDGEALISAPTNYHSLIQHRAYITHRDNNRVATSSVLWRDRHLRFGARMLNASKPTLIQLARSCRLLYDLYQHGRNRAKGDDSPEASRCHLCGLPDSLEHIALRCNHSKQREVRKRGVDDFLASLAKVADPYIRLTIDRIYQTSLNTAHGYLIWCGVWTDNLYSDVHHALAEQLPPHHVYPKSLSKILASTLSHLAQTTLQLVSYSSQSFRIPKPSGATPTLSSGSSYTPVHTKPAGQLRPVQKKARLQPSQRTITSYFRTASSQTSNPSHTTTAAAAKRVHFIYLDSSQESERLLTSDDLDKDTSTLAESSSQFTFSSLSHSQEELSSSPPWDAAEALKSQPLSAQLVRGPL